MLGGQDQSVPTAESAPAFRAAFEQSANRQAHVRVFPRANHGLLASAHYFEPEFQSGLVAWIRQQAGM